jgi:regulator of sirC expression with transglutaminase-like and TPR domain
MFPSPSGHLLGPLLALSVCISAYADDPPSRTWKFDVKTPGAYDIHVQYKYDKADTPQDIVAKYSIHTKEKIGKQEMPLSLSNGEDGYRVHLLRAAVPNPQTATVVVTGVPLSLLQKTRVYLVEANSVFPDKLFDPKNSTELKSAQRLREILERPEQEIDLGKTKLTLDKMVDPTTDIEANLRQIDKIVADVNAMAGVGASNIVKLRMLRRYLFDPGVWNNFTPYRYNLENPKDDNVHSALLSTYLSSKKGTCVTMPFLFVILGQRLGLDVTASNAPQHFLVKYKVDAAGPWHNMETTSGGYYMPEEGYREQFPIADQALKNGIYLQPLTKKQTAAVMGRVLIHNYMARQEYDQAITIANLILEYSSKDVEVMLNKSGAFRGLMARYYGEENRSSAQMAPEYASHLQYLLQNNRLWWTKANDLGWRERSKEDWEKYQQMINEVRQTKAMSLN